MDRRFLIQLSLSSESGESLRHVGCYSTIVGGEAEKRVVMRSPWCGRRPRPPVMDVGPDKALSLVAFLALSLCLRLAFELWSSKFKKFCLRDAVVPCNPRERVPFINKITPRAPTGPKTHARLTILNNLLFAFVKRWQSQLCEKLCACQHVRNNTSKWKQNDTGSVHPTKLTNRPDHAHAAPPSVSHAACNVSTAPLSRRRSWRSRRDWARGRRRWEPFPRRQHLR